MSAPAIHPRAGLLPAADQLVDLPRLVTAYYTTTPDAANPAQRVAFGTSGHRGSSLHGSFNEAHILAITQAVCDHRRRAGIDGPLFIGADTHALSTAALATALEVLAANDVAYRRDARNAWVPTPVVSHAILRHNRTAPRALADGLVITPSHNPPEDGGFKYDPPSGGPAGTEITTAIQDRANDLLAGGLAGVCRMPLSRALAFGADRALHDFRADYVADLEHAIDVDAIRAADVRLGVDPLGGAGVDYWGEIADRYRIPLDVISTDVDATFRFMTLDWDGRIRMDCSSPYAMQRLIGMRERYDVAWACDTDHDRHGIVAGSSGLMNPNAFLAAAIEYLCGARPGWSAKAGIGKTVVSSGVIDRVAADLGRALYEVPVGFKWFVDGLCDGSLAFGGEESAGASFVRRDGAVWTTDKDGILLGLLAAEMTAATGRDPGERYAALTERVGGSWYARIDAAATPEQKRALGRLDGNAVAANTLAGDPITARLTRSPGNDAPIGGLKVVTPNGWFAARPSGTEDVYKLYAESFVSDDHLRRIQEEAQGIVGKAIR